jgi:hypothetical protein
MENVLTVFAVYRADEPGPVDPDAGICWTCVALFGNLEEAIAEVRPYLREKYSTFIEVGAMTEAEFDALDEVPDDFQFTPPLSAGAEDRK